MKYYKPKNETILYLNTEWNCNKTTINSKNTIFSWNVRDIVLNDMGKLSVFSIVATGITASNPYIFRIIPDIQIETADVFLSDYSTPIISLYQQGAIQTQIVDTDFMGITLKPQVINKISISVDDDIATKTGIATSIKFIIGIKIEEIDLQLTQMNNPYQEAISRQIHQLL